MLSTTTFAKARAAAVAVLLVAAVAAAGAPAAAGTAGPVAGPRPLGTLTLGAPSSCLDGYGCTGFTVEDCPGIPGSLGGTYGVARPAGEPLGVLVFLSGGGGRDWFGVGADGVNPGGVVVQKLVDDGFVAVQLRWDEPGWMTSPPGNTEGPDALACRPATVLRHLHDAVFAPLGLTHGGGACGFCVMGVSGGASAIAYALTAYGLDPVVDAAVLGSGPPHGAIDRGCLGEPGYAYSGANRVNIDRSYGFADELTTGWCRLADPDAAPAWRADSAVAAGSDHLLATTRVALVLGGGDEPAIWAHARAFAGALTAAGTPAVGERFVRGAPHALYDDAAAMAVVAEELRRAPAPAGPRVLLVVGRASAPGPADQALRAHLEAALGATVTVRDDGAGDDVAGHDVVVVADSVARDTLRSRYRGAPIGVVDLDATTWPALGLAARSATTADATTLTVVAPGHPVAPDAGERSVSVATSATAVAAVDGTRLGGGGVAVLAMPRSPGRVAVAAYEAGAALAGGDAAPARRVAVGYPAAAVERLTAAGWDVVDDAVAWAAGR